MIYAHILKDKKESLEEHNKLLQRYKDKLKLNNVIDNIIDNILKENNIPLNIKKYVAEQINNIFLLHDIGKSNYGFQHKKMNNDLKGEYVDTKHSKYSTVIYLNNVISEIVKSKYDKNPRENKRLQLFLINLSIRFSYCILQHHAGLDNFNLDSFIEVIKDTQGNINDGVLCGISGNININENLLRNSWKITVVGEYSIYILIKIVYSMLIACDFCATYQFMNNNEEFDFINKENLGRIENNYYNNSLYKSIQEYDKLPKDDLNRLRSEMFLEVDNKMNEHKNDNKFFLEAPTGGGKTNISINLALKLLKDKDINKMIYGFPFNTLIDQTSSTLNNYFNKENIGIVNSINPMPIDEDMNYNKALLNKQLLNYLCTITSHVSLFNALFGTSRDSALGLIGLCNSVIILDEIQSYKNTLWKPIINFLNKYADLLNIKLIIMSATLPKLDELIKSENTFIRLLDNKKYYFEHELFKNRVRLNFDLLDKGKISKSELITEIKMAINNHNVGRVLVECIKIKTACEIYELVKEDNELEDYKIFNLTSEDNKKTKEDILNCINEKYNGEFTNDKIILIATQVIEAGVDIDMDIGFKDISILDAEEQFLGRINRNCKRKGYAYFFDMDDECDVYREDYRTEYNLLNKEYRNYLENKDFEEFYGLCFKRLEERSESIKDNYKKLLDMIGNMEFLNVFEYMKLIDQITMQLYLNYNAESDELWSEYIGLLEDKKKKIIDFAEFKYKLSEVKSKMNEYIFNLKLYDNAKTECISYEHIGGLYLLNNADEYINEGKFDKKKYMDDCKGLIL